MISVVIPWRSVTSVLPTTSRELHPHECWLVVKYDAHDPDFSVVTPGLNGQQGGMFFFSLKKTLSRGHDTVIMLLSPKSGGGLPNGTGRHVRGVALWSSPAIIGW